MLKVYFIMRRKKSIASNIVQSARGRVRFAKRKVKRRVKKASTEGVIKAFTEEVLPGINCATACIRKNFGHRIGLSKSVKRNCRC